MSEKHILAVRVPSAYGEEIVRIGDTVLFFPNCSLTSHPSVGIVTRFHEGQMADISIITCESLRTIGHTQVYLVNSPSLANPNNSKRGCWSPRPPGTALLS